MKMKLTLTFEYETNPENYDTADPAEMAAVDKEQFEDDPMTIAECLPEEFTLTVEPMTEGETK